MDVTGPDTQVSARPHGVQAIGWTATAVGVAALASAASLGVYFGVGGPFGTINDVGNAVIGVLAGTLAWLTRGRGETGTRQWLAALAVLGSLITVVGSVLVVSGATGYLLAGNVSSVGFALVGLWLIAHNRSLVGGPSSRGLRRLGTVAGVIMALGLANVPAIVIGADGADAPAWVWAGGISWLGTYLVFPTWSLWYAVRTRR